MKIPGIDENWLYNIFSFYQLISLKHFGISVYEHRNEIRQYLFKYN